MEVIPVMTRLKVHHQREGGVEEKVIAKRNGLSVRSVERILKEAAPTEEEIRSGMRAGQKPRGRPSKARAFRAQVEAVLKEDQDLPGTEVLRLAKGWGYQGGASAMYELAKRLRPEPSKEPVVRFEGLPGEFAQFDFGEASILFEGAKTRRKVQFFAGRLKYSRFMHVELVDNQQAETVIRSVLACLAAFGGSTKEWVFDNPRTIRISPNGEPLVLHPFLRDLVADMRVIPTLCTPRQPNQKGTVENLVGFVKKNLFFARKFKDMDDLKAQLGEWLREVNHVRPCDATGEIPAKLLADETKWLQQRPLPFSAKEYPLRESATVKPMAFVTVRGSSYMVSPKRIGATATVMLRAESLDIILDREKWTYPREDWADKVFWLPELRKEMVLVVHGERKRTYFKRECILELGDAAQDFLEQLVHRHDAGTWAPVVHEVFDLLQQYGPDATRQALASCHAQRRYTAGSVLDALRRAA
jgi:transposase